MCSLKALVSRPGRGLWARLFLIGRREARCLLNGFGFVAEWRDFLRNGQN